MNSHIKHLMTNSVLTRDIDGPVSRLLFTISTPSLVTILSISTMFHIALLLHVLSLLKTRFKPKSGWEAL